MANIPQTNEHEFEILLERPPPGIVGRFLATTRHVLGLFFGGLHAYVRDQRAKGHANTLGFLLLRLLALLSWPFLDKDLIRQPFPVQFRRRLELLGPTYIKLGQILSLRDDLLPQELTDELRNHLLDRLPALPFKRFLELLEADLNRPVLEVFHWVSPVPLGSASLAQSHRAELLSGEAVVIKMLKPGVRQTVWNDTRLLRLLGATLQIFLSRYQPARLIDEFCRYTRLEVDLHFEADNAETFTANFADEPDVRFPKVFRQFSSSNILCMEYFQGRKPSAELVHELTPSEREKVIDLGVGATVRMIFRDGFFHADLHPGNLIVFDDATVGFIDLGMVGRFDSDMQRGMISYFYSLSIGDPANAARYLTAIAYAGRGADATGFRRAVEDLNRRWLRSPTFQEFSLGQLVLQSVALAGRYRIQYPGDLILMIKALITIEGVGNQLAPGLNVTEAAGKHIRRIVLSRFNVTNAFQESLLVVPEMLDVLMRSPLVLSEGLRVLEQRFKTEQPSPLAGLRGTILAVGFVLAGAIVVASAGPIWLWVGLFVLGVSLSAVALISGRL